MSKFNKELENSINLVNPDEVTGNEDTSVPISKQTAESYQGHHFAVLSDNPSMCSAFFNATASKIIYAPDYVEVTGDYE